MTMPTSFFDMFDFFTSADLTNGYVSYMNQATAQNDGLIATSNGFVYMGVDSTNTISGSGRASVRVASKKSYNHGLTIPGLAHIPGGICGIWPAFWMVGPSWPTNGEIGIIGGVNSAPSNDTTLHTNAGCSISDYDTPYSDTLMTLDCDVNAPGQATNAGCLIKSPSSQTFGCGFNAIGGGVYATEWTSTGLFSIWLGAYRIHELNLVHDYSLIDNLPFLHHYFILHDSGLIYRFSNHKYFIIHGSCFIYHFAFLLDIFIHDLALSHDFPVILNASHVHNLIHIHFVMA